MWRPGRGRDHLCPLFISSPGEGGVGFPSIPFWGPEILSDRTSFWPRVTPNPSTVAGKTHAPLGLAEVPYTITCG